METIYDHNPTPAELRATGNDRVARETYLRLVDAESAWTDLALLFRQRGDADNETRAWSHVPDRRDEFMRGFDVIDLARDQRAG